MITDEDMKAAEIFRRVFHLISPLFLMYYIVPQDTWIGISKVIVLLIVLLSFLIAETIRISFKISFSGLRDYEGGQITAYTWGGIGLTIALLFFHQSLVVVSVCGMAWIDPLCALSRRRRLYPYIPSIFYAVLAISIFWLMSSSNPIKILALAAVGSTAGILSEYPNLKYVDDDFLMIVFPLIAMAIADSLLQNL